MLSSIKFDTDLDDNDVILIKEEASAAILSTLNKLTTK
jgi:hypothetical protein